MTESQESFRSPPEPTVIELPPSDDAELVCSEPPLRLNAPPVMATRSTETLPVGDAPPLKSASSSGPGGFMAGDPAEEPTARLTERACANIGINSHQKPSSVLSRSARHSLQAHDWQKPNQTCEPSRRRASLRDNSIWNYSHGFGRKTRASAFTIWRRAIFFRGEQNLSTHRPIEHDNNATFAANIAVRWLRGNATLWIQGHSVRCGFVPCFAGEAGRSGFSFSLNFRNNKQRKGRPP